MLKIKDGVDLIELAQKYNFTVEYDSTTGEIKELYRINGHYLGESEKNRLTTVIRKEMFKFDDPRKNTMWKIFKQKRELVAGFSLRSDHQDLDLLFDLIQDGLVEKV